MSENCMELSPRYCIACLFWQMAS